MDSHDLTLAIACLLIAAGGCAIATAWRRAARRRAPRPDSEVDQADARRRLDAAIDAFDFALVHLDETPVLAAGPDGLAACAGALGLAREANAAAVVASIMALDVVAARALATLTARGEACAFTVATAGGLIRVEGRVCGAWAWLRLELERQSAAAGPRADQLAALIDTQDDPAWISDATGAPLWTSRGWRAAVDRGDDAPAAIAAGSLARDVDELICDAAAAGEPRGGLHWVATSVGRRAFNLFARPIPGGLVAAWARDVTEARTAVDALNGQAADHSLLLGHIGDAVALFDADRRLEASNPPFAALWDLEPAWLAERPSQGEWLDRLRQWRRLPETVDYGQFKANELAAHQQREAVSETVWRLPSERTLRVVRMPRRGGGLILIFSDITPELRLKSQFNHLIQVQRATLDKLTDAVAVFGADGRLKLHNEAFETFWAITPGLLQRTPDFDGIVELCLPRVHDRNFWRGLKGRITDPDPGARAPTRGEVITAERRHVAYQSRPLPDGATLIGFSDVTDTRRLEEALRDREAALSEAERLKRAFVGSVSYELRTPLTTIIGYAELLERNPDALSERERGYVAAVRAAANHLARSIEDVLETAEIDAGETVLEIADVDVGGLLQTAAARRAAEAEAAGVVLTAEISGPLGSIRGDAAKLGRVLDHLLDNALRQSRSGGAVTLSAVRALGEVRLTVSDDGRGFPFDVQAYIFDRFSSHNRGGPGLGLSLVKALVELHGGWVALENEPGAGAVFTCHLPEEAQAPEAAAPRS